MRLPILLWYTAAGLTAECVQFQACISSGGNDCPRHRLSEVYTGSETNSTQRYFEDFDEDQEDAASICHISANKETLFEGP